MSTSPARSLSLRQGIRRGRRLRAAELPQRPLLAFQLLGPALRPVAGTQRAAVLPRGHRLVLLDDRAALRRKPLHAPRRQPLDRDAIGADRADARRHLRVLSEAQGRVPRSAELVGAGSAWAASNGTCGSTTTATRRISSSRRSNTGSATASRRSRAARSEVGSVVELFGGADNICVSSDFPHFDSSFPEVSTRVMTNPSISRISPARSCPAAPASTASAKTDFAKADAAMQRRDNLPRRARPGGGEIGRKHRRREKAHGTRRLSDPRQRPPFDGAGRSLGALSRRALPREPAAVLRRAAATADREQGRQGQRRQHQGDGGAGAGDPCIREAARRDRIQPRVAAPQPRAPSAFQGRARARFRSRLRP